MPLGPRVSAVKWVTQSDVEEKGTVLFFGRSHPHKGLEYLIQAQPMVSSRVPNARFLIVAHGDDLERYRHMIKDKSKIEIYDGFRPSAEAMPFFQKASLVVLPYLSASTSGILMTAYVFAKPVVATEVGCLPEYVLHGETGLLVPPKDPSELAKAISLLLLDDDLRRRMGENARRLAEEQQKKIGTQLISIYNKAIDLKRNRNVRKER
jgi:glycosyltransferase involved in cell wall biosynthesis